MEDSKKELKKVITLHLQSESVEWGVRPGRNQWKFFRTFMRFVMNPEITVWDDLLEYQVELYDEFVMRDGSEGNLVTSSCVAKIEKISSPFEDEPKDLFARILDWMFWPRRYEYMLRFTTELGSNFVVPFSTVSPRTVENLRAVRWGASDEIVAEF